jgi:hypothetical protein
MNYRIQADLFSAYGSAVTKRRLLAIEGAAPEAPTPFDCDGGLKFATRPRGGVKAGRHRRGRQFAASLFQLLNFAALPD